MPKNQNSKIKISKWKFRETIFSWFLISTIKVHDRRDEKRRDEIDEKFGPIIGARIDEPII